MPVARDSYAGIRNIKIAGVLGEITVYIQIRNAGKRTACFVNNQVVKSGSAAGERLIYSAAESYGRCAASKAAARAREVSLHSYA
jgi:hypothetical protein